MGLHHILRSRGFMVRALACSPGVAALMLLWAPALPAGQAEFHALPGSVTVTVESSQDLEAGLHALEPLDAPRLNGQLLAAGLLHETTVFLPAEGDGIYAYHDLFLRRWHDRTQSLVDVDGHPLENLNALPVGAVQPKILEDAWSLSAPDLFLDGTADQLWWSGTLVWRFAVGHPLTSLSLTDPLGILRTVVDDTDWQERGQPVVVSVSADGTTWHELWRSTGEGGTSTVEGSLPASLRGATTLYLRFVGQENALADLHVTLGFDASAIRPGLRLEAGSRQLTVEAGKGRAALLFWTNPGVELPVSAPSPPASVAITEEEDRVIVDFPSGGRAVLCRGAGAVTGPCSLSQDGLTLLEAPRGGTEPAALTVLEGEPVAPYTDWSAEVDRFVETKAWTSTGTRTAKILPLGQGEWLGTEVQEDGSVLLAEKISWGGSEATVAWQVRPETLWAAGRTWKGVSWRVILQGLPEATAVNVTEPIRLPAGWWWLEQVFRGFSDERILFTTPWGLPPSTVGSLSQSFRFAAGPDGAMLALFHDPLKAPVAHRDERGRRLVRLTLPLGTGTLRATPWRSWLRAGTGAADAWAARDLWAEIRDAYTRTLTGGAGLGESRPRPTVVWNQPLPDYYEYYRAHGAPPEGKFWLDEAREKLLPRIAAARLDTLYLQPPWENDAEHTDGGESGHAPRALEVSPALGGPEALRRFVDRAHELGLHVVLWYPSSYSLRAPFLDEHPDWAAWTARGTPDDGGWGDIVGVDLASHYLPRTLARIPGILAETGADGFWLDSWDGLTLLTDYSNPQPTPQVEGAIELLRAMWRAGATQVILEGLSPLARSDAYGDYESWAGPPQSNPRIRRELERLRGREYMLHRIGANTTLDTEVYFRALAAGGMVNVMNMDEVDSLEPPDHDRLLAANTAFAALEDLMDRRRLVVRQGRWVGVSWSHGDRGERALFAFEAFDEPVASGSTVREVTAGTAVAPADGVLHAEAWKAYRISPPPASPRPPSGRP